jgi:6,7-dimethyl-8-ribityllumazine synthase
MKVAIAVSDWNPNVTHLMLNEAKQTLLHYGVQAGNIHIAHVPGSFELVYAAHAFIEGIPTDGAIDAVIVLGCVVRGGTPHFEYVCQGVTQGIAYLNSTAKYPTIFGVLTTDTMEQAEERANGKTGNKGAECAVDAIKMIDFVWRLK